MSGAKSSTARGRLRTPRRDGARRTAIVRRATEIFKSKGFAHTTIEDIAEAVGVTREAIYYYFRDKAEILIEIIKPESDYLVWGLERILSLDVCSRKKLVMAVESHMMRFNPNYLEMAIAVRELNGTTRDPRIASLRLTWRRYTTLWIRLIEEGQSQGTLDRGLEPRLVAFAILGMLNSASSWFDPSRGSIAQLTDTFVRLVATGVLAEGVPARSDVYAGLRPPHAPDDSETEPARDEADADDVPDEDDLPDDAEQAERLPIAKA
ncbi:TetR/AcrR family transcriptional regulator [Salinarimonas ramus]|uniref:Transcriptional regulator, TetR family protein n=1 Tax=Salinarimonas ramus TaxID=690164 RepID=A0A917QDR2_9HYPH|nr:TetR/AcrR family transcriptional regulator [Salinarimonas ramus]GGK44045.1 putative transcriptional regulator, TetR family protein [Salinarimonas ramus]